MSSLEHDLAEQYTGALKDFLAGAQGMSLQRAYELGGRAVADGVGVVAMANIHRRSLDILFGHSGNSDFGSQVEQAAAFFAECLSPFEKELQAKDEFVAILSHELRTPLMIILGWTRVLKRRPEITRDSLLSDAVRSLDRNAHNISLLVKDCLDIARISERRIELEKTPLELNQLIRASLEAGTELAGGRELTFLTYLPPSSRLWVVGDKTRLQDVLLNLLSNAIKYTKKGGVISVRLREVDKEAEIEVRDTGIGISPDLVERIFQPRHQGSGAWLSSGSGLGLGLAIARGIVNMHGGRIWAESDGPGCGSTFKLRIPLTEFQQPRPKIEDPKAEVPRSGIGTKVLFIEDSKDILDLMKLELERFGYAMLTAMDGESGLEIARQKRPDIIVSDIKMPGVNGYELIRRVRGIPELASVPAVALTGFGRKKDIEKALSAGYNAHLCKPVDPEELDALIQKLIVENNPG